MKETKGPDKLATAVAAPLYIRWEPDKSPYAIELKLDLVIRLRDALSQAAESGIEIGGVLVGLLPTQQVPTLRIEDLEFLPRRSSDGTTFILEGGGERFAEVRRNARARERTSVGVFRSHLRAGPLRPSLADRTLLATEFKEAVYALLLVHGNAPYNAAFFVASHGPLPGETSVREFRLDPSDFQELPELEPAALDPDLISGSRRRFGWKGFFVVLCGLLIIAGAILYLNQSVLLQSLLPSSGTVADLTIRNAENSLLRVDWNHGRESIANATGGTLTIRTDGTDQQIRLGPDDLRLGSVVIDSDAPSGSVDLVITGDPGGDRKLTARWNR